MSCPHSVIECLSILVREAENARGEDLIQIRCHIYSAAYHIGQLEMAAIWVKLENLYAYKHEMSCKKVIQTIQQSPHVYCRHDLDVARNALREAEDVVNATDLAVEWNTTWELVAYCRKALGLS